MTPVPGAAGLSSTVAAPTSWRTSCGIVFSTIGTVTRFFFACFDGFANRFGNFARLADREADLTLAIADDDERAEAEALAALDDLRDAIDAYDGLFESTVVAIATTTILH